MNQLLSRKKFREEVFKRDKYTCVFCDSSAKDAHHILERRLFPDGGYYIDNGASVCRQHHLECEQTLISVEDVRAACGIKNAVLPPHLYRDCVYDKWGNIILDSYRRLPGELFEDESVKKILREGKVLSHFTDVIKYPRTFHVPFSPGVNKDDRTLDCWVSFMGKRVIVTEKLDGENTSLYTNKFHARSVDSSDHPSRTWIKMFHASICGDIPYGLRVCGENLYAKHSIHYPDLKTYFYGFSVWEGLKCLSWEESVEWMELLGITPVPVLYDGPFDEKILKKIYPRLSKGREAEGWVMRVADEFSYREFKHSIAKFVRANHVNSDAHWRHGAPIIPNGLSNGINPFSLIGSN